MANLDDFFAAKDKKKKSKKGFSKANTDVLAKNLEESARKEQKAEEKATTLSLATSEVTKIDNPLQEMGVSSVGRLKFVFVLCNLLTWYLLMSCKANVTE